MIVTLSQLQAIAQTSAGRQAVVKYADHLAKYMPLFGITSKASVAAFIAQVAHESGDFMITVENLNYSAQGMANTWPSRYAVNPKANPKVPNALANRLARRPEAIANNCYANRMGNGNEASGDGWRYRGRGLIQLTGKESYAGCGKGIGVDLVGNPDLVTQPEVAVQSACWEWKSKNLTPIADRGDFLTVTKLINGGTIGLASRELYHARALRSLV